MPVRETTATVEAEALSKYLHFCAQAGNAQRTLSRKHDSIKRFLSEVTLRSATPATIQKHLCSFEGKSAYYQKRELDEVKKFFAYCTCQGIIEQDVSHAFPSIKAAKDSKIPSVFSSDEVKELLLYLSAKDSKNRLRDYAMVLLMAIYGLRSADVANLHLGCLNIDNGTLAFSQTKTGNAVRHVILPHLGNALADYILNERPDSNSPFLFLKQDGKGLSSKTIGGIVRSGFMRSNVDVGRRKCGSHSLRHSVASGLINDGHSIFTVANVLGGTSAETARLYAKVDFSRLSLCALEVPVHE